MATIEKTASHVADRCFDRCPDGNIFRLAEEESGNRRSQRLRFTAVSATSIVKNSVLVLFSRPFFTFVALVRRCNLSFVLPCCFVVRNHWLSQGGSGKLKSRYLADTEQCTYA